ncbi:MAG: hypothetical protein NTU61_04080, partial [Candidatus Altiarchaeota archaeon]|nr:hypothetical protein [Candidatus Altiarchaeota archaeon]
EILQKFQGKQSFTEDDIKHILKFNRIQHDFKNPQTYEITSRALKEPVLAEKLRALKRLSGVGIIISSSILAFQNPYKYAIMSPDSLSVLQRHFGLPVVHKEKRGEYSIEDYLRYLDKITSLSEEYGMKPFDIEFALGMIRE